MKLCDRTRNGRRRIAWAFTLIELLVVLFVIAVLCSLLLPALSQARQNALSLQCQSNLRTIGQALKIYEVENKGWFYPVVIHPTAHIPQGRGIWQPPHERWPMYVFKVPSAPMPPPYDSKTYRRQYDPDRFPVTPYTPPVLRCPTDVDPVEAHTYVLNGIAAQRYAKAGSSDWGGLNVSEVVLACEKYTQQRDYYIETWKLFEHVVDPYRHGPRLLSNYLFFDGHVSPLTPAVAQHAINPWESSQESG